MKWVTMSYLFINICETFSIECPLFSKYLPQILLLQSILFVINTCLGYAPTQPLPLLLPHASYIILQIYICKFTWYLLRTEQFSNIANLLKYRCSCFQFKYAIQLSILTHLYLNNYLSSQLFHVDGRIQTLYGGFLD